MTSQEIAERNNISVAEVEKLAALTPTMLERIARHRKAMDAIFEGPSETDHKAALLFVAGDLASARERAAAGRS